MIALFTLLIYPEIITARSLIFTSDFSRYLFVGGSGAFAYAYGRLTPRAIAAPRGNREISWSTVIWVKSATISVVTLKWWF